ncbi:hypothetical protein ACQEVF_25845 [Nonomuraea polychroma]|uniref:hypothetical protein n=1 Tax=Nonomuraea polychroma TaxID=46176 RepID=UPI003D8FAC04
MMLPDLRFSRLGHFPVACIVVMLLMTACSVRLSEGSGPSARISEPFRSASAPPTRPLTDLRKESKGKVLLHHVADTGDQTEWVGKLKVGNSYKIAVACVGCQGKLAIVMSEGFRTSWQCAAGYSTFRISIYPDSKPKARSLTIKAPLGARWAVLVSKPS